MTGRFDRHLALFGHEGQQKINAAHVSVIGAGGLGSIALQQLALLGAGRMSVIDSEELAESNRNRYVTARVSDPIPGTRKVDIAERLIKEIDPSIRVDKIADSFITEQGFRAVIEADFVLGCLDSEGARLVLNELCAAYEKPYIDLASDVVPGDPLEYGGRVCSVVWSQPGCLVCRGVIDLEEAQRDLLTPEARRDRDALYGVDRAALGRSGPSVVSLNGVIASLGVTEFMVAVTGLRDPKSLLTFYGRTGRLTTSIDQPEPDCYYCNAVRGKGAGADVQRYVREGFGEWVR